MNLKSLELENVGPIRHINVTFSTVNGSPKPTIFVGENGAGKSIILSHIVNSLIAAKQAAFEDTEVETGKVFKYRSPHYIRSGENYSFSRVRFINDAEVREWQLFLTREDYEKNYGYVPYRSEWNDIELKQGSSFVCTFDREKSESSFSKNVCLYFPANRFEQPGWLNVDNLKERPVYKANKKISGISNRNIICSSPLKQNQDWLLDVLYDRNVLESVIVNGAFVGFSGDANSIYNAILDLVKILLGISGELRIGLGKRHSREINVIQEDKILIRNLFQLSTGQVQILNMFLSIIRDFDLAGGVMQNLSEITGVVVIDEVDLHLHVEFQRTVLPRLISAFSNVQFIITSHSPLFLIGMQEFFGREQIRVIELPNGHEIQTGDFVELEKAYEVLKTTSLHRSQILAEIKKNEKPCVFVEGATDIDYIKRAASLLDKEELMEKIKLLDGDGFGNLEKIWRTLENPLSTVLPSKVLLLFDCDTKVKAAVKGSVFKSILPQIADTPIQNGIENLFPSTTIAMIEQDMPHAIDVVYETTRRERGVETRTPEKKTVCRDEKSNLCRYLCEIGDKDDFQHFTKVFQLIEEFLESVNFAQR